MKLFRIDRARRLDLRRSGRLVVTMLAAGAAALALAVPGAQAGTANGGLPGAGPNPIAHIVWGVPHDDDLWSAYQSATGSDRELLGRLAQKPQAVWLGWENPIAKVQAEAARLKAPDNIPMPVSRAVGIACLAAGWLWSLDQPIIKHIWTSAMVLWSAGWSLLLLALFYYVIDVRGCRRWR